MSISDHVWLLIGCLEKRSVSSGRVCDVLEGSGTRHHGPATGMFYMLFLFFFERFYSSNQSLKNGTIALGQEKNTHTAARTSVRTFCHVELIKKSAR